MGFGVAEGVTVEREASDGENDAVVFYTSNNCDIDTVTAQDEGGCVEINGPGDSYGSFNVISGQPGGARRKRNNSIRAPGRKTTGYETDEEGNLLTGTNAPAWHEAVENSPYYHGLESEYNGKLWKWHQVAKRKWSGLKPEDWDDSIHIKNDTLIEFDGSVDCLRQEPTNALEARGLCGFTQRCTAAIGSTTANFAYNAVLVYYRQVAQLKKDPQGYIWNALNTPFVQTIVVVINSRSMPGHATSDTHDTLTHTQNQLLAQCQSQHDQINTLIALHQASLEEQRLQNQMIASVLSKLTDQQGGIHTSSFQATQDGQNPAKVGSCDNGPTPNSKREIEIEEGFLA
ncbi:uncharacterized protein LY89DRAFT_737560 [Mollisia scopiformis]|uniref:Uncharacterized protein n=1 Tax=Mollisia scopiformis TaxID=149040 RepID=A0A194X147_MOLSC|nr:uncharacterized protein LY89DRAFT_737560 [Mollisia scopiformis]KUJ13587.1 hypothetical protein LY89DRAFT_737560 [Mollisia scopiformis]